MGLTSKQHCAHGNNVLLERKRSVIVEREVGRVVKRKKTIVREKYQPTRVSARAALPHLQQSHKTHQNALHAAADQAASVSIGNKSSRGAPVLLASDSTRRNKPILNRINAKTSHGARKSSLNSWRKPSTPSAHGATKLSQDCDRPQGRTTFGEALLKRAALAREEGGDNCKVSQKRAADERKEWMNGPPEAPVLVPKRLGHSPILSRLRNCRKTAAATAESVQRKSHLVPKSLKPTKVAKVSKTSQERHAKRKSRSDTALRKESLLIEIKELLETLVIPDKDDSETFNNGLNRLRSQLKTLGLANEISRTLKRTISTDSRLSNTVRCTSEHLQQLALHIDREIARLKRHRKVLGIFSVDQKMKKSVAIQSDLTWDRNLNAVANVEFTIEKYSSQHKFVCTSPRYSQDEETACRPRMRTIGLQQETEPHSGMKTKMPSPPYSMNNLKSDLCDPCAHLLNNQIVPENNPTVFCCFDYDCSNGCGGAGGGCGCGAESTTGHGGSGAAGDYPPTTVNTYSQQQPTTSSICTGNPCRKFCQQRYNMKGNYNGVVCNQKSYMEAGTTPCSEYNYCRDEYYYDYSSARSNKHSAVPAADAPEPVCFMPACNAPICGAHCGCCKCCRRHHQHNYCRRHSDLNTKMFYHRPSEDEAAKRRSQSGSPSPTRRSRHKDEHRDRAKSKEKERDKDKTHMKQPLQNEEQLEQALQRSRERTKAKHDRDSGAIRSRDERDVLNSRERHGNREGRGSLLDREGRDGRGSPLGREGRDGRGSLLDREHRDGRGSPLGREGRDGRGSLLGRGGHDGRGSPRDREGRDGRGSPLGREGRDGRGSLLGREHRDGRGSPLGRGGHDGRGSPRDREGRDSQGSPLGHGGHDGRGSPLGREGRDGRGSPLGREHRDGRGSPLGREHRDGRGSPLGREGRDERDRRLSSEKRARREGRVPETTSGKGNAAWEKELCDKLCEESAAKIAELLTKHCKCGEIHFTDSDDSGRKLSSKEKLLKIALKNKTFTAAQRPDSDDYNLDKGYGGRKMRVKNYRPSDSDRTGSLDDGSTVKHPKEYAHAARSKTMDADLLTDAETDDNKAKIYEQYIKSYNEEPDAMNSDEFSSQQQIGETTNTEEEMVSDEPFDLNKTGTPLEDPHSFSTLTHDPVSTTTYAKVEMETVKITQMSVFHDQNSYVQQQAIGIPHADPHFEQLQHELSTPPKEIVEVIQGPSDSDRQQEVGSYSGLTQSGADSQPQKLGMHSRVRGSSDQLKQVHSGSNQQQAVQKSDIATASALEQTAEDSQPQKLAMYSRVRGFSDELKLVQSGSNQQQAAQKSDNATVSGLKQSSGDSQPEKFGMYSRVRGSSEQLKQIQSGSNQQQAAQKSDNATFSALEHIAEESQQPKLGMYSRVRGSSDQLKLVQTGSNQQQGVKKSDYAAVPDLKQSEVDRQKHGGLGSINGSDQQQVGRKPQGAPYSPRLQRDDERSQPPNVVGASSPTGYTVKGQSNVQEKEREKPSTVQGQGVFERQQGIVHSQQYGTSAQMGATGLQSMPGRISTTGYSAGALDSSAMQSIGQQEYRSPYPGDRRTNQIRSSLTQTIIPATAMAPSTGAQPPGYYDALPRSDHRFSSSMRDGIGLPFANATPNARQSGQRSDGRDVYTFGSPETFDACEPYFEIASYQCDNIAISIPHGYSQPSYNDDQCAIQQEGLSYADPCYDLPPPAFSDTRRVMRERLSRRQELCCSPPNYVEQQPRTLREFCTNERRELSMTRNPDVCQSRQCSTDYRRGSGEQCYQEMNRQQLPQHTLQLQAQQQNAMLQRQLHPQNLLQMQLQQEQEQQKQQQQQMQLQLQKQQQLWKLEQQKEQLILQKQLKEKEKELQQRRLQQKEQHLLFLQLQQKEQKLMQLKEQQLAQQQAMQKKTELLQQYEQNQRQLQQQQQQQQPQRNNFQQLQAQENSLGNGPANIRQSKTNSLNHPPPKEATNDASSLPSSRISTSRKPPSLGADSGLGRSCRDSELLSGSSRGAGNDADRNVLASIPRAPIPPVCAQSGSEAPTSGPQNNPIATSTERPRNILTSIRVSRTNSQECYVNIRTQSSAPKMAQSPPQVQPKRQGLQEQQKQFKQQLEKHLQQQQQQQQKPQQHLQQQQPQKPQQNLQQQQPQKPQQHLQQQQPQQHLQQQQPQQHLQQQQQQQPVQQQRDDHQHEILLQKQRKHLMQEELKTSPRLMLRPPQKSTSRPLPPVLIKFTERSFEEGTVLRQGDELRLNIRRECGQMFQEGRRKFTEQLKEQLRGPLPKPCPNQTDVGKGNNLNQTQFRQPRSPLRSPPICAAGTSNVTRQSLNATGNNFRGTCDPNAPCVHMASKNNDSARPCAESTTESPLPEEECYMPPFEGCPCMYKHYLKLLEIAGCKPPPITSPPSTNNSA